MAIKTLHCAISGRGLHEITHEVAAFVHQCGVREGLCTVFSRHTSASLVIQENADPACQRDLERWLNRLVPENDPDFTHVSEGADDMPGHIKSTLTATSLGIPIADGKLVLGTWQGIFLWEHRDRQHQRQVVIHVGA